MLDQNAVKLARERIRLEIAEQNSRLRREVLAARNELASRGLSASSVSAHRVGTLCATAAKERAQLAWQILYRFITTAGVAYSAGLSDDLKKIVGDFLPPDLSDLQQLAREEEHRLSATGFAGRIQAIVEQGRVAALKQIANEIDLFCLSLERRKSEGSDTSRRTTMNFYSPVGAVQTGSNAVAYVSQQIDAAARDALTNALRAVEEALAHVESLPTHPKGEVLSVVHDVQAELKKTEPNSIKLRSLLTTVAFSIQTVASARPAYDLLRTALLHLGITLP